MYECTTDGCILNSTGGTFLSMSACTASCQSWSCTTVGCDSYNSPAGGTGGTFTALIDCQTGNMYIMELCLRTTKSYEIHKMVVLSILVVGKLILLKVLVQQLVFLGIVPLVHHVYRILIQHIHLVQK